MTETSSSHFEQPLLPTPFHRRARALSQVDSFIPWAGYTTVDVFTTVEQEYFAIRNAATLYDLTPMIKYRVAGRDAVEKTREGPAYIAKVKALTVATRFRVALVQYVEETPHPMELKCWFFRGERQTLFQLPRSECVLSEPDLVD